MAVNDRASHPKVLAAIATVNTALAKPLGRLAAWPQNQLFHIRTPMISKSEASGAS